MIRILIVVILFLFFTPAAYAVSISLSDYPSTISTDEFSLQVHISGAKKDTTNYLRIDLYKDGTSDYLGYTQNNGSFYNGSDHTQYPNVLINPEGSASAQLTGKVDIASSKFKGAGNYKLRVRRYTESGGYSTSEASNGSVDVSVSAQLPTSTPTPLPTPTKTPTPTPVKKSLSSNTTRTPTLQKTLTYNSDSQLSTFDSSSIDASLPAEILGEGTSSAQEIRFATKSASKEEASASPLIASASNKKLLLFFIPGVVLVGASGIILYSKAKKRKNYEQY